MDKDREGKRRILQTESDEKWEAATQIQAPDESLADYRRLWKVWDKMQTPS